jgi:cytochrome c553
MPAFDTVPPCFAVDRETRMNLLKIRQRSLPIGALGIGLVIALTSASALAQTAPTASQALQVRSLAATCAACHGTDGQAVPNGGLIGLRGRDKEYLATQLNAFRAGTRPATVMQQIAKGYTPEQIDQLAAYFAAQTSSAQK